MKPSPQAEAAPVGSWELLFLGKGVLEGGKLLSWMVILQGLRCWDDEGKDSGREVRDKSSVTAGLDVIYTHMIRV